MNKKINYRNGDYYEGEVDKEGLPHGLGKYAFADGVCYHAEWIFGYLQMDTVKFENVSGHYLVVKIHSAGFDYNRWAMCMLPLEKGEYTLGGARKLRCEKGWKDSHPLITITSVDEDKMSFVVPSHYVDGNDSVLDSISSGEKKKYSCSRDCVATIYDEDYDYTIKNEIVIECK